MIGAMVESMPVPMPLDDDRRRAGFGLGDLVNRLVLIGAEVLGDLADGKARDKTADDRAEQPQGARPRRSERSTRRKNEEDHDDLETRSDVGAAVERLVKSSALLCPNREKDR